MDFLADILQARRDWKDIIQSAHRKKEKKKEPSKNTLPEKLSFRIQKESFPDMSKLKESSPLDWPYKKTLQGLLF